VDVHFVLVHNPFSAADLQGATVTFSYSANGGATQSGTATFTKVAGSEAQFDATVAGVTGSLTVTGGSLTVNGQTISLHNAPFEQNGLSCGPGSSIPEAPLPVGLPLAGLAVVGGYILFVRRRAAGV